MRRSLAAAFLLVLVAGNVCGQANIQTQNNDIQTKTNVEYAVHDGVALLGDLYQPATGGAHPAMLFIHGGGFRAGSKAGYGTSWGPFLAARGIVVFAIDYRLATATQTAWPAALLDCKAALQYLRGNAAALGIDPARIGVGGDSAGGGLAALVGLTQDNPQFANKYPADTYASVSTKVKVTVPIYGVHDMTAWEKYTASNSTNKPALDLYFGGPPEQMADAYREGSPISYVRQSSSAAAQTAWFLAWGMVDPVDPVVPPEAHSVAFAGALREAGANVTTLTVPGVGHFWFTSSALTGKQGTPSCPQATAGKYECSGATPNDYIAAKLLEFLAKNL